VILEILVHKDLEGLQVQQERQVQKVTLEKLVFKDHKAQLAQEDLLVIQVQKVIKETLEQQDQKDQLEI
jgi:hypothetical protein